MVDLQQFFRSISTWKHPIPRILRDASITTTLNSSNYDCKDGRGTFVALERSQNYQRHRGPSLDWDRSDKIGACWSDRRQDNRSTIRNRESCWQDYRDTGLNNKISAIRGCCNQVDWGNTRCAVRGDSYCRGPVINHKELHYRDPTGDW